MLKTNKLENLLDGMSCPGMGGTYIRPAEEPKIIEKPPISQFERNKQVHQVLVKARAEHWKDVWTIRAIHEIYR